MSTLPKIGEIVMSPHEKYKEGGVAKFDQLLADGSEVTESSHPLYFSTLTPVDLGVDILLPSTGIYNTFTESVEGEGMPTPSEVVGTPSFSEDGMRLQSSSVKYPITYSSQWTIGIAISNFGTDGALGTRSATFGVTGYSSGFYGTQRLNLEINRYSSDITLQCISATATKHSKLIGTVNENRSSRNIFVLRFDGSVLYYYIYFSGDGESVEGSLTPTGGLSSWDTLNVGYNPSNGITYNGVFNNLVYYDEFKEDVSDVVSSIEKSYTPNMSSPNSSTPYRIVADLTEEV